LLGQCPISNVDIFTLIQSLDIEVDSMLGYWRWSNFRMLTDASPNWTDEQNTSAQRCIATLSQQIDYVIPMLGQPIRITIW